ncbi:hypothetical protein [Paenibacillus dakarensis]|uniref:hypothetical protein n=1 Tax=Paenibacillus dakarensis TaxID=1527293 RepID=UPI000B0EB66E|nr:hypothetical protein [Paenibacillus dakarensis]
MDKRKVITAYQRGLFSVQECGQILGLESFQINAILDPQQTEAYKPWRRTTRYLK